MIGRNMKTREKQQELQLDKYYEGKPKTYDFQLLSIPETFITIRINYHPVNAAVFFS